MAEWVELPESEEPLGMIYLRTLPKAVLPDLSFFTIRSLQVNVGFGTGSNSTSSTGSFAKLGQYHFGSDRGQKETRHSVAVQF